MTSTQLNIDTLTEAVISRNEEIAKLQATIEMLTKANDTLETEKESLQVYFEIFKKNKL